jgi:ubiquinone biosynthesis protein Coq4
VQSTPGAVRFHDPHHVVTGYTTDFQGEMQISAWEIGAGCKRSVFAWQINLGGLAAGMLFSPRLTAAAFMRGRHSDTLYGRKYDVVLRWSVRDARAQLRLDARPGKPHLVDWLLAVSLGHWAQKASPIVR